MYELAICFLILALVAIFVGIFASDKTVIATPTVTPTVTVTPVTGACTGANEITVGDGKGGVTCLATGSDGFSLNSVTGAPAWLNLTPSHLYYVWDSATPALSQIYDALRALNSNYYSSGTPGIVPYQTTVPVHKQYIRKVVVYVDGARTFDDFANFVTPPTEPWAGTGGYFLNNIVFVGIGATNPTITIEDGFMLTGDGDRMIEMGFYKINLLDSSLSQRWMDTVTLRWNMLQSNMTIAKTDVLNHDCIRSGLANHVFLLDQSTITMSATAGGTFIVAAPGVGGFASFTMYLRNSSTVTTDATNSFFQNTTINPSYLYVYADTTSTYDPATIINGGGSNLVQYSLAAEPQVPSLEKVLNF